MHALNDRFANGMSNLGLLDHEAPNRIIQAFKDIAPDFAKYIMEFQFGDIYSRTEINTKTRLIAAIAGLTALGNAAPQLKFHINAALNAGCTREELVEVIMQMALTAGFPAAFNALLHTKEVYAERDARGLLDAVTV